MEHKLGSEARSPVSTFPRQLTAYLVQAIVLFAFLWIVFYAIYTTFPYINSGAEVIFNAKIELESHGQVFVRDPKTTRIIMFGNSKALSGFLPNLFDRLTLERGAPTSSFNSGFSGQNIFLPQLKLLAARGETPNIVLLTLAWEGRPQPSLFDTLTDDHVLADRLFPFRHLIRDIASFLVTARRRGGISRFYEEGRLNVQQMIQDRGYYFISEQSLLSKGDRLPDDFHLPSDRPDVVENRQADINSSDFRELQQVLSNNSMRCFFVPSYLRVGERAPPPQKNEQFAKLIESHSDCKVIGPDYFLLPNKLFSDQAHLNRAGAQEYTRAVYKLLSAELSRGPGSAL